MVEREAALNDGIQRDEVQFEYNVYISLDYEYRTKIFDSFVDVLRQNVLSDTVIAQPAQDTKALLSEVGLLGPEEVVRMKTGIAICTPTLTAQDIYSNRVYGQGLKTRILRQV